ALPLVSGELARDGELDAVHLLVDLASFDVRDHVGGEIEHLLQRARADVQDQAERARHAFQVPEMAHRRRELDVAHALTPHFRTGDLHAAAVADDPLELDLLIATAVTLPVLDRTEDALAEKAVALRFEGTVIDRLRLFDLAVRPVPHLIRGRDADLDLIKAADVSHIYPRFTRPLKLRLRPSSG